jgi:hypothetical protein
MLLMSPLRKTKRPEAWSVSDKEKPALRRLFSFLGSLHRESLSPELFDAASVLFGGSATATTGFDGC